MKRMKTRAILLFMNLLIMFGSISNLPAQVTIGASMEPLEVSVLELISDATSIPKGLRLPQLSAIEIDALTSNIHQLPDADIIRASGMIVFNTTTSCMMLWNGNEFKSLCGDIGPAEMTFDCANMRVYPNSGEPDFIPTDYKQGTPIDGSESYIIVPVIVTKAGTYTITATTGNGYSFSAEGRMLDVGNYDMKLEGRGTPIMGNDTPQYYDEITLTFNNENLITDCSPSDLPQIPVTPATSKANYIIECTAATSVSDTYVVDVDLNSTNTITVQVNVTSAGFYAFTAEAAGMHFSRSGQWPAGTTGLQQVTLLSSGKATQGGVVPITIKGETSYGEDTCEKNITVAYRTIKIVGFGGDIYQPGSATASQSAKAILQSQANFGLNGTVPTQGITIFDGGYTAIKTVIDSQNPDIIVIGYNAHTTAAGNAALIDFIQNKKGVVLAFTQDNQAADSDMINAICGSSISLSYGGVAGTVYQFLDVDHPILNGPFGDIRNKYWGEDQATTFRLNSLPAGAITFNAGLESMVYGDNFLWVGDGGFMSGNANDTRNLAWPSRIDSSGRPIPKANFGINSNYEVYNSVFYANAIAWAIKYVQANR